MKPKLLYCLALLGLLFILSFTLVKREPKNSTMIACNKVEEAAGNAVEFTTDFMFVESLSKYILFSVKR